MKVLDEKKVPTPTKSASASASHAKPASSDHKTPPTHEPAPDKKPAKLKASGSRENLKGPPTPVGDKAKVHHESGKSRSDGKGGVVKEGIPEGRPQDLVTKKNQVHFVLLFVKCGDKNKRECKLTLSCKELKYSNDMKFTILSGS